MRKRTCLRRSGLMGWPNRLLKSALPYGKASMSGRPSPSISLVRYGIVYVPAENATTRSTSSGKKSAKRWATWAPREKPIKSTGGFGGYVGKRVVRLVNWQRRGRVGRRRCRVGGARRCDACCCGGTARQNKLGLIDIILL